MDKKTLFSPIIFLFAGIAFGVFSLLVFLTNGKNATLVRGKLRLGAIIVTLTGALFVTNCKPQVLCYSVPYTRDNMFVFASNTESTIHIPEGTRTLDGRVTYRSADAFSYRFTKTDRTLVARGPIEADVPPWDETNEAFTLPLPDPMPAGKYLLYLYPFGLEEQKEKEAAYIEALTIVVDPVTNE